MNWTQTELREVMRLDLDSVRVDPGETYDMVGVYSFGRGLFRREPQNGANTSYKFFYRLKPDHVVMSQLFGWEGALALSSGEFAGLYVSSQFPTFLCHPDKLDRRFLGWLIRRPSFWRELGTRSKGIGDRRRTLNPESLLKSTIPLPPLDEQRRLVIRIDALFNKIEEAKKLGWENLQSFQRLLVAMAHREDLSRDDKLRAGWQELELNELIRPVEDIHMVSPDRAYPNLGIFSYGRGAFKKPPIQGALTSANTLKRVHAGQFIYSRLFAFEGAYALVPDQLDAHFVSNEYPTFECSERIRVEFLYAYFKSSKIWNAIASGSKGLGHRRQRVQPDKILAHRLMLPPLHWQDRIRSVMAKADSFNQSQTATAEELNALMPSILSRAFSGEL